MRYLFGFLAGAVWGLVIAFLNGCVSKKMLSKNSTAAYMTMNFLRMLIDVAALAIVFLLRKLLPFSYELALVGTAASLSIATIVMAFRMSKPEKQPENKEE